MALTRFHLDERAARSWRRFFACAALMALLAGGMWAWPRIRFWRESEFAAQLARYSESAPDGPAVLTVRQIDELGLPGVESLVRLAGSTRQAVAAAAQDAVLDQLNAWETGFRAHGDERLLGQQLLVLASAVERWASGFDPAARAWADRLTLEIVDAAGAAPPEQTIALLAVCDEALAASPMRKALGRLPELPATSVPEESSAVAMVEQAPVQAAEPIDGGIEQGSSENVSMADGVSVTDLAVVTEQSAVQVRQFAAGEGVAERLPPAPRAKPSATADRRQAKVLTPAPEVKPKPLPARPPSADVIDVPSPQLVRANLRQWRQASDAELAMQLRSASPYDALAIATVMRERGLAGGNVAEWKGNLRASTDGGVFEGLSQLPPAQVRERLRQLATHADPDVRLKALTLMATSGDPQLDEIVRRRAVEDADPRVAELAGRIMRGEMK